MLDGIVQDPCEHPRTGSYFAFLVRLWQDSPQAGWRASAQPTHGGEIVHFADLDALFAFLLAQTQTESDVQSPCASDGVTSAAR